MPKTTVTLSVELDIKERAYEILKDRNIKVSHYFQSCLKKLIERQEKLNFEEN
jgi:antitoxin component of RelBE/YafQ-DinJ toxin-antitoxin module